MRYGVENFTQSVVCAYVSLDLAMPMSPVSGGDRWRVCLVRLRCRLSVSAYADARGVHVDSATECAKGDC